MRSRDGWVSHVGSQERAELRQRASPHARTAHQPDFGHLEQETECQNNSHAPAIPHWSAPDTVKYREGCSQSRTHSPRLRSKENLFSFVRSLWPMQLSHFNFEHFLLRPFLWITGISKRRLQTESSLVLVCLLLCAERSTISNPTTAFSSP